MMMITFLIFPLPWFSLIQFYLFAGLATMLSGDSPRSYVIDKRSKQNAATLEFDAKPKFPLSVNRCQSVPREPSVCFFS